MFASVSPKPPSSAYLGISLGTNFYSIRRIESYFCWSKIHYDRFSVLIGDWIYAYTHGFFYSSGHRASIGTALAMGDAAAAMCEKASRSSKRPIKVIRWNDLRGMQDYKRILPELFNEYANNKEFRIGCISQIIANLGERVSLPDTAPQRTFHPLVCYLLHEICGLIVISEYTDYSTEVYPGKDLGIVTDLYAGRYPVLLNFIPIQPKRSFVSLIIE
jgi:tRNA-dependent cyclodipeptide synthase